MPDRIRIVRRRGPGYDPITVLDVGYSPPTYVVVKDTLSFDAGVKRQSLVDYNRRGYGQRVVGETHDNALLSAQWMVGGATAAVAAQNIQTLLETAESATQTDMLIERRPDGSSLSTYYEARSTAKWKYDYDWTKFSASNKVLIPMAWTVAPWALGPEMDVRDDFDVDTGSNYTVDTGSAVVVAKGRLTVADTTFRRIRHTGRGYSLGDVQVLARINGAGTRGVAAKMDPGGADTMLVASHNGATLSLFARRAGVSTSLASTAWAAPVDAWIRLRVEGNVITVDGFNASSNPPYPSQTPTATLTFTLASSDIGRFAAGHAGLAWTPGATTDYVDSLIVEPFTYASIQTPEQIRLIGAIPGDVAALADIIITPVGGTGTPVFGLASWWERAAQHNLCWNGDFENATNAAAGWSIAAVTGVSGACTSISRSAGGAYYGVGLGSVVFAAVANSGTNFPLYRRFKKGRVYLALAFVSGTTQVQLKLGTNGDVATSASITPASAFLPITTTWIPTADRDSAVCALVAVGAAGGTTPFDAVNVVECPNIALSAAISTTGATTLTVYSATDLAGLNPDGTLPRPFLALIDSEIIRVTAISGQTWTIDRGLEGTTAATHVVDSLVLQLPASRLGFEGAGAQAPVGVIEAESFWAFSTTTGTPTITVDANCRGGNRVAWAAAASGNSTLEYFLDPSSLVPDDYTLGEIDIEIWVRDRMTAAATSPQIIASMRAEGGATNGPTIYASEFGSSGRLLTPPITSTSFRMSRLGVIPMVTDPAAPVRWRLVLQSLLGAAGNLDLDYILLCPTRAVTSAPTGKANDVSSASGYYPSFVPYDAAWGAASAMTKRMRADNSATIAVPGRPEYPDAGLGRYIELPDAPCELLVKLSNLVPDDPTSDATTEENVAGGSRTAHVHVAITPRTLAAR